MSKSPSDQTPGAGKRDRDPFESVASAAFGPDPESPGFQGMPAVLQKILSPDAHPDPGPAPGGRVVDPPDPDPSRPRYRILGRIARGGIGVVVRAMDIDLEREVALKVLRKRHLNNPALVRRFHEEARIAGQLQHPGVVPVHALEQRPGAHPCFAMKLVRGTTLSALLTKRNSHGEDRRRFLLIFEKVCETLAYAHDRGVIHRDLKPLNIMVGAFGEVQVMDWGLAKVLHEPPQEECSGSEPGPDRQDTLHSLSTRRRSHSETGSVMGTPAYMAPEQARGEVERVNERTDTFALGAILCEILTGDPPYVGKRSREVRLMAVEAKLKDAKLRLNCCGADQDLVNLALSCLAPDRDDRPEDAGTVLAAVTDHRTSLEKRVRTAEVAAAAARARASEEQRARRLTLALGAAIIFAVLLAAGAFLWVQSDRLSRQVASRHAVNLAIDSAASHHLQARTESGGDLSKWTLALASAGHAETLARSEDVDEETRNRARRLLATIAREETRARKAAELAVANHRMVDSLEETYVYYTEHHDEDRQLANLRAAFLEYGLDLEQCPPEASAARVRDSGITEDLVAALETWAYAGSRRHPECNTLWRRLIRVANMVNPDPWRMQVREAFLSGDLDRLKSLAASEKTRSLSPRALDVLATTIGHRGAVEEALALYRFARRRYPDDYNLNIGLAHFTSVHMRPPSLEEAIHYLVAATSIRPQSYLAWGSLGMALLKTGDLEGAADGFREAIRIRPDNYTGYANLGLILLKQGDPDAALASYQQAVHLDPTNGVLHYNVGLAHTARNDEKAAIAAYREAIRLKPDYAPALNNLGVLLRNRDDLEGAAEAFRDAIRIIPGFVRAYHNLGITLTRADDLDGAIKAFRKAVEIRPVRAEIWMDFGTAIARTGRLQKALTCFERALEAAPEGSGLRTVATESIQDLRRRIQLR